jgi:hypothetical protein
MPDGLSSISSGFNNISTAALMASVLWGGIGGGFLVYGWRQKTAIPFVVGAALSVVSYFMLGSALLMSAVSVLILGAFIWAKKRGY